MEKNIEKILADLYMIDDSLKPHEEELKKVIAELISARPEAEINEQFLQELRSELIKRVNELKAGHEQKATKISTFSLPRIAYVFGGVALVLIIIIPLLDRGRLTEPGKVAVNKIKKASNEIMIAKKGDGAFGDLSGIGAGGANTISARPMAGGGEGLGAGAPSLATRDMAVEESASNAYGITEKMIMPPMTRYEYVYKGDEIPAVEGSLEVYKRIKSQGLQNDLARNVAELNFGILDLSKFTNTNVTNISMVEDREFGYSLYFNLLDNNLSISTNWEKWPRPDKDCRDQACFDQFRLSINDVPADEELIAIADSFVKDYNIDLKNFGKGQVVDNWRKTYEETEDKNTAWIPEVISVVYPLVLNGEEVYDESGNKTGVSVEVNIRYKKASGLYNVMGQTFESSNYEAETNVDVIKKVAENGGRFHPYYYNAEDKNAETATIELGTPKLALVQYWQYDEANAVGYEIFVPSYIFPVISKPKDIYFYQQTVVVPLIKDLLKGIEGVDGAIDPTPRPLPVENPGAGEVPVDPAITEGTPGEVKPEVTPGEIVPEVKPETTEPQTPPQDTETQVVPE
jgi:hypothetical protein